MQTITFVVFVILEVTSRLVSGKVSGKVIKITYPRDVALWVVFLMDYYAPGNIEVLTLGCGDIDAIIRENDLRANSLKVYSKKISKSSYQAVFNINGKEKTLTAGNANLMLVTKNETINKWTTFSYSEAVFSFIQGSPMKIMMYDPAANYYEAYLGSKRVSSTACQNILCEPYIRLPPYYWFKKEVVEQGDEKYTLYSTHFIPSMEQFEPRTGEDAFFAEM